MSASFIRMSASSIRMSASFIRMSASFIRMQARESHSSTARLVSARIRCSSGAAPVGELGLRQLLLRRRQKDRWRRARAGQLATRCVELLPGRCVEHRAGQLATRCVELLPGRTGTRCVEHVHAKRQELIARDDDLRHRHRVVRKVGVRVLVLVLLVLLAAAQAGRAPAGGPADGSLCQGRRPLLDVHSPRSFTGRRPLLIRRRRRRRRRFCLITPIVGAAVLSARQVQGRGRADQQRQQAPLRCERGTELHMRPNPPPSGHAAARSCVRSAVLSAGRSAVMGVIRNAVRSAVLSTGRSAVLSAVHPRAEGARHGAHGIERWVGRCVGHMRMQPDESCNRHREVGALEGAGHRDERLAGIELQAQLRRWAGECTATAAATAATAAAATAVETVATADAALALASERRRGRQVCQPVREVSGSLGGRRSTGGEREGGAADGRRRERDEAGSIP